MPVPAFWDTALMRTLTSSLTLNGELSRISKQYPRVMKRRKNMRSKMDIYPMKAKGDRYD